MYGDMRRNLLGYESSETLVKALGDALDAMQQKKGGQGDIALPLPLTTHFV